MLNRIKKYIKTTEVDRDTKWRNLLKELYTERELLKRERNALKKEVGRLQAICDCQAELLGGQCDQRI